MDLIHGTLNGWEWDNVFYPSFSISSKNPTLIQFPRSIITLQFLSPVSVDVWKRTIPFSSFFSPNYEKLYWWWVSESRCLPDAVVWNVFTFLIIIGVITCFFIHLVNYFFWIRLNSVLDVTLWWQFVQGIFQKDINKFHNKRGDFRRNQSTILGKTSVKFVITGVALGVTHNTRLINVITLDLFVRVIVF